MSAHNLEAKIVVLGSQGVGKTSLVHRYVKNAFAPPSTTSTIGASFLTKRVVDIDTSSVVRLQIWDTAGQERFRSISKLYYRGANAGVLCYDITDPDSFEEMGRWLQELKQNLGDDIILHIVGTKSDIVAADPSKRAIPFERCIAYVAEHLYPSPPAPPSQPQPQPASTSVWGRAADRKASTFFSSDPDKDKDAALNSPQSNRSSGFWGQEHIWDCCHEVSAKDGEGVDEVFRVITRKLVEQRNKALEEEQRQFGMASAASGGFANGSAAGYFDQQHGDYGNPNGSFRVGVGDKRRSWLGLPTTPGGASNDPMQNQWEADIQSVRRKKGGRCC